MKFAKGGYMMKLRKMFCVLLFIALLFGQFPVGKAITIKEEEPFKKIQNVKTEEKLIKKEKKLSIFKGKRISPKERLSIKWRKCSGSSERC